MTAMHIGKYQHMPTTLVLCCPHSSTKYFFTVMTLAMILDEPMTVQPTFILIIVFYYLD
jgi:hypothetical protein